MEKIVTRVLGVHVVYGALGLSYLLDGDYQSYFCGLVCPTPYEGYSREEEGKV